MCECGCAAFCAEHRFPGPGESVYVLTIFPGCDSCDAPAGVDLHRIDPSKMTGRAREDYDDYLREQIEAAEPVEFWPIAEGQEQTGIGFLTAEVLEAAIQEHTGADTDGADMPRLIEQAVRGSKKHFADERAKSKAQQLSKGGDAR